MEIVLRKLKNPFADLGLDAVLFDIYSPDLDRIVGRCEFRDERGQDLWIYGHLGYVIYPPYRGHNFAYKATKLMLDYLAKEKGLQEFVITCNPDNIASKKIIKRLDGRYLQTLDIPQGHELLAYGESQKEIYLIDRRFGE